MANYIKHHGIKGQKWGVRRFQEKDGDLTPAGRKRYNNEKTQQKMDKQKKIDKQKETINNVSKKVITKTLTSQLSTPSRIATGKQVTNNLLNSYARQNMTYNMIMQQQKYRKGVMRYGRY